MLFRSVVRLQAATAGDMRDLGARVAHHCRAGDVLVLTGDLGAGKTTFTQGLARGLGISDPITSPTFVIARTHRHPSGGTDLVHVDAYRLGSRIELDDLDLDADLDTSVAVVEWGGEFGGLLAVTPLDVCIVRSDAERADGADGADVSDDVRIVELQGSSVRWGDLLRELSGQQS